MANVTTDLITETYNGQNPTSALVQNPRSQGATTLVCNSLAGWPTNTAVHFATYRKDVNGNKVAGSQSDWKGVVSSNSITNMTLRGAAPDAGNGNGDIVEMMPTYSWGYDLALGLEKLHNNDGSFKPGVTIPGPLITGQPTITDFTDAQHSHANAAGGGQLNQSNMNSDVNFSVYRSGGWTTANLGYGLVTFDAETDDKGSNYNVSTGKFTAPIQGWYLLTTCVQSVVSANGLVANAFYVNGSLVKRCEIECGTNSTAIGPPLTSRIHLNVNDYVQVYHYGSNNTGGQGSDKAFFEGFIVSKT